MTDTTDRLQELYRAFNARDIDTVLDQMTGDVDWPNAWEGGRVRGHYAFATTGPRPMRDGRR
jgi:hypothetical protein